LFAAGGGDADFHGGHFLEESFAEGKIGGDAEEIALEGDLQADDEVAFGDVVILLGKSLGFAGSDHDGKEGAAKAGEAEEIDHGPADAGAIDGEAAGAFGGEGLSEFGDAIDDAGISSAEGQALDVAEVEGGLFAPGVESRVPFAALFDALGDGEGGEVAALSEIEAKEVSVHRRRS
jgi:hypothetical protein